MNKINTEMLVSSLFVLGFDKVDPILFTYTLGKLSIDNINDFKFDDSETSQLFAKYVECNEGVFSLKKGISLDTVADPMLDGEWTLRRALSTNKELLQSLKDFDFKEIVMKKVDSIGLDRMDQLDYLFSNKEKTLIREMFKVEAAKNFVKRKKY